jgi:sec-independent protein translocase protein TatB
MPDVLFILLLALVIFGPRKLPEVAGRLGKFVAQLRLMSDDLKRQVQSEMLKIEMEEKHKKLPPAPELPTPLEGQAPNSLDQHTPIAG